MLITLGVLTAPQQRHWLAAARACRPERIVEVPFGTNLRDLRADVLLVAPDGGLAAGIYGPWLATATCSVMIITGRLSAATTAANTYIHSAIVCHPICAEEWMPQMLLLAANMRGGVQTWDIPPRRQVERGVVVCQPRSSGTRMRKAW